MKAILIDVYNKCVRQVEIDDNNVLDDWYKYIGCKLVDHIDLNDHDSIMVDDEGLLTMTDDSKFFSFAGNIFVGNGLVVGVDDEGNTVDPCITVEKIRFFVTFPTKEQVDFID